MKVTDPEATLVAVSLYLYNVSDRDIALAVGKMVGKEEVLPVFEILQDKRRRTYWATEMHYASMKALTNLALKKYYDQAKRRLEQEQEHYCRTKRQEYYNALAEEETP